MSHSTIYRICLLVVVILTIIGGIFYYVNYMENEVRVTEGTLVRETLQEHSLIQTEIQNLPGGLWEQAEKAVA